MAEQRTVITDVESRQEGSRWIGERPTGDELGRWFAQNVHLDEGMRHEDWVGGITLISSTEKMLGIHNGAFVYFERLVHVPYARVDARISYFWELCRLRGWRGEIHPVGRVPHLPPGFARLVLKGVAAGKEYSYLACTQKVSVYERDVRSGEKGRLVMDPPPATKQVAMLNRAGYPDDNLMMKAETGAVGRALGMAGIFVLPGSGVATAEDMAEFLAAGSTGTPPAAEEPQLPADSGSQAQDTRGRIADLERQLGDEKPEKHGEYIAWAEEKDINLQDPRDSQLRSMLRKLEQMIADA